MGVDTYPYSAMARTTSALDTEAGNDTDAVFDRKSTVANVSGSLATASTIWWVQLSQVIPFTFSCISCCPVFFGVGVYDWDETAEGKRAKTTAATVATHSRRLLMAWSRGEGAQHSSSVAHAARRESRTCPPTKNAADISSKTYQRLNELAAVVLHAGFPVVIDATYLKHEQRLTTANVAEATGAPFLILDCAAPKAVIRGWLAQRQAQNSDPSDATMEVIEAQLASREPLTADETLRTRHVETNLSGDLDKLVTDIRQCLPGL